MKKQTITALICGYGVPKQIFDDLPYHSYLTQCANWLYDHHHNDDVVLIMNGGATDCHKPYKRTEAGEIKKWLNHKLQEINKHLDKKLSWKVVAKPKSLSSVENLLNLKSSIGQTEVLIFCEKTRAPRIKKLSQKIFGKKKIKIIPIDFDGSARRYVTEQTKQSEKDFLHMEARAATDATELKRLRAFMKKKLSIMREYSAKKAHERLPQILEKLHQEQKDRS